MALNQVLVDYIQNQIRKGYSLDYVKDFLINQGYNQQDVNSAVEMIAKDRLESIKSYINQEINKGYDAATIKARLLSYGYKQEEVDKAMKSVASKMPGWAILVVLIALVIIGGTLYYIVKPSAEVAPGLATAPVKTPVEVKETENVPAVAPQDIEKAEKEEAELEKPKVYEVINASKDEKIMKAVQMCDNTANEIYKDACFDQLSKATRDYTLCEKITDLVQRDNCYKRTAIYTRNQEVCAKISDPRIRSDCQLFEYVL